MVQRDALAARLRAVFLDELDEQVAALNASLLVLEGAHAAGTPPDPERLREVFRVAHTLKGAARAAGVGEVEALCHAFEAMLSEVRDGRTPMDERRLQQSFAAADALTEAGRRLRAGEPVGDVTEGVLRMFGGAATTAPASLPSTSVMAPPPPAPAAPPATIPSTPAAPMPTAEPTPEPTVEPEAEPEPTAPDAADERVRVAVVQLDLLQASAAQLRGRVAALEARPGALRALRDELLAWRTEWEAGGERAAHEARFGGVLRQVGALLRDAENDARQAGVVAARLADQARRLKLRPFGDVAAALPRVVRDVAQTVGREVRLELVGQEVEADRGVLDALRDALLHLVRNAVDHGIEAPQERARAGKPAAGALVIGAAVAGERLRVTVADDGRGLDVEAVREALRRRGRPVPADDREAARALFEGGVSTRAEATAISGRGVGLDVVGATAARLGGSVDVRWRAGAGTTFTLDVPVTLATTRALVVDAGAARVAVPTAAVQRVLRVPLAELRRVGPRLVVPVNDELLPVLSLAGRLGAAERPTPAAGTAGSVGTMRDDGALTLLLVTSGERRGAVRVDDVLEERDFVAQPLAHAGAGAAARYTGVVLRDADEALPLVAPAYVLAGGVGALDAATVAEADAAIRARVLVVDDSITTRALEASVLEAAGFDVVTAVDGVEAMGVLERGGIDLVVTDIEMPRMDGITLCETIRRTPRLAALPVVVVTSLDRPEQRARGLEAGADAYVTKSSFDQDDFLRVARQLVADRAPAPGAGGAGGVA